MIAVRAVAQASGDVRVSSNKLSTSVVVYAGDILVATVHYGLGFMGAAPALTVESMTANGAAMTFLVGAGPTTFLTPYERVEMWYQTGTPVGTTVVEVTIDNAELSDACYTALFVYVVSGAYQPAPFRLPATDTGPSGTRPQLTVQSEEGDLVLDAVAARRRHPLNLSPGQTLLLSADVGAGGGEVRARASSKDGAYPSVVMEWGGTYIGLDAEWAALAVSYVSGETVEPIPPRTVVPTVEFIGADITPLVIDWGKLEQIQTVLLGDATILSSQLELEVANRHGLFSPNGDASLIRGMRWYGRPLRMLVNGELHYEGLILAVKPDPKKRTVRILTENILRRPAEKPVAITATSVRPGAALLAIFRQVVAEEYLIVPDFLAADAPAAAVGASLGLNLPAGGNVTALEAARKVASLASILLYVRGSRIGCRVFRPYQGAKAGLRFPINDAIVREWGRVSNDITSFNNVVTLGYYGSEETITLINERSRRENNTERGQSFSATDAVYCMDRGSAVYFGGLYLSRASYRRAVVPAVIGREGAKEQVGYRYPVTNPELGYNELACECSGIRKSLTTDDVELTLVSLQEPEV